MQFFDTHVHFDRMEAVGGVEAVVARARAAGVERMIAVGGSPSLDSGAEAAARAFRAVVRPALGYDRDQAGRLASSADSVADAMAGLRRRVTAPAAADVPMVALGEMGLDYHYAPDSRNDQMRLFEAQLALARELTLPAIVHSRDAEADTLALLGTHAAAWGGAPDRLGVVHCFTGSADMARRLVALGMYISFSGILTFRNADALRAAARMAPDDCLLVETDSPFLAPTPVRGCQNEPAHVRHVVCALAEVRGSTIERIAALTFANALRLFG